MTQTELNLTTFGKISDRSDREDRRRMVTALGLNGGWMTRADLRKIGISDRTARDIRRWSKGTIIFGQRGFRLARTATLEELHKCAATLNSQADAMRQEAAEIWRVINRREEK